MFLTGRHAEVEPQATSRQSTRGSGRDIVQLGGMRERSRRCQRTLGLSVADLALQLKLERPHPSLPLPFSSFLTGASPGLKISSEQQAEPLKGVWTEAESPAGSRDPDRPLTLPQKKNSPDLHQSQEHSLAKVGWTCPPCCNAPAPSSLSLPSRPLPLSLSHPSSPLPCPYPSSPPSCFLPLHPP